MVWFLKLVCLFFFCKFICLQWKVEYRGGVGGFMQIPAYDEVFYPTYSDLVRRDLSHGKRRQREQVSYFDKHWLVWSLTSSSSSSRSRRRGGLALVVVVLRGVSYAQGNDGTHSAAGCDEQAVRRTRGKIVRSWEKTPPVSWKRQKNIKKKKKMVG